MHIFVCSVWGTAKEFNIKTKTELMFHINHKISDGLSKKFIQYLYSVYPSIVVVAHEPLNLDTLFNYICSGFHKELLVTWKLF